MASAEFPPASFDEIPIIFISTHGVYDLTIEPEPFTVPENVYIFETQTIGDVCMTPLDKPLWNLMGNRPEFLQYFKGEGDLAAAKRVGRTGVYDAENEDDEHDTVGAKHRDYKKVFRNMHFYQPGDTIYNRTLMIGGGGDGARRDYANMGFYRFDVGAPIDRYPDGPANRIRPMQPLRTQLIGDEDERTTQREIIDEVAAIYPETVDGVIYIFSSCGAFWKEDDGVKTPAATLNRRMRLIETTQQTQDLALMELTTAGPGGAGANNNAGDLPAGRNLHSRAAKKGSAAFAPPPTDEEGEEAFFENDNADFANRDPRLVGPDDAEEEAYAEVDEAAAERAEARAAAVGKKSVFLMAESGHFRQIPTPMTAKSAEPDLLFSARDIRDAKKAYGKVYGFSVSAQRFHLLGGGTRRVSRKAVPRRGRRHQTRRRL